MSEENYPGIEIAHKLSQLGEAFQGIAPGAYAAPANFPGKKIADEIDKLIAVVLESGVGGGMTPQERQYLDDLIDTGALDRIYWSVIVTTTQVGSITTDRVYLNIAPDALTTESAWSIAHSDGSVLERDGKQIAYTKDGTTILLSDANGNVLEHKFHIPAELTVTAFNGNPSDDINNVYISVEFDIRSLHEVIGDTDSLTTTEKVVVSAINEIKERLSRINAADRFIAFDSDTGWKTGLTNDTHGGHIRLLDKTGAVFLDIDVAAYGSGLEAVFAITFVGGEFSPAASYAQGDRAHHRKAVALTGWPEVTECTLAYTAKNTISPGPWNESEWDLRNDSIAGAQINTYAQIARDGFIFTASHQMTWDHEPALDEFIQDDWYLINRLPVVPGKFAIFMLDNSTGQVGWLAADELAPFTGTNTIDIDAQGNVSLILNTGGILERTDSGLLLKWYLNDGVYTLGSDGNVKFYDKSAIDLKLNDKQNNPTQQSANVVYAGPSSGNAAIPTYRKLVAADIPNLDVSKLEGILTKAQGGTGNANGTADTLSTPRAIQISGTSVGSANFDGSGDINIVVDGSVNGVRHQTFTISPNPDGSGSPMYAIFGFVEQAQEVKGGFGAKIYFQVDGNADFFVVNELIGTTNSGASSPGRIKWREVFRTGATWPAGAVNGMYVKTENWENTIALGFTPPPSKLTSNIIVSVEYSGVLTPVEPVISYTLPPAHTAISSFGIRDYSTAEVAVGNSYLNGKTIYQRTFTGTMPVTDANAKKRVTLLSGAKRIINTFGSVINIDGTGTAVPVNVWYEGIVLASFNSAVFIDGSGVIMFGFKSSAAITSTSDMTYEITLQYTKA